MVTSVLRSENAEQCTCAREITSVVPLLTTRANEELASIAKPAGSHIDMPDSVVTAPELVFTRRTAPPRISDCSGSDVVAAGNPWKYDTAII